MSNLDEKTSVLPSYRFLRDSLIRGTPLLRRCWTVAIRLDLEALKAADKLDADDAGGLQATGSSPKPSYSCSWHNVQRYHSQNQVDSSGVEITNNNSVLEHGDKLNSMTVAPIDQQTLLLVEENDADQLEPLQHSAHSDTKRKPRKRVATKFNSFDYFTPENEHFLQQQSVIDPKTTRRVALIRWLMNFLVGIYVAIVAVSVTLCNKYITQAKLTVIYSLLEDCRSPSCLLLPTLVWMLINMSLVFVGAYIVTFHAPLAAGSGIPNVKCYLNGIKMPGLMNLRTLLAKAGGVILSVSGGLACGKEGPMIHSGAICASSIAKAEFTCFRRTWKPLICEALRTDEERRDFVAAGAASGVSAAFGSPIGGVLFSLEEGASFLRQMLTWRMLFSSMTACLFLNIVLSSVNGYPGEMSHPGLVSFGHIGHVTFYSMEIPIFALMGVAGGLVGATFVHINYKLTMVRRRYITKPWPKVLEAILVAGCSAVIFMSLIYGMPDCQPIRGYNATIVTSARNDVIYNVTDEDVSRRERRSLDNGLHRDDVTLNDSDVSGQDHHLYGLHGSHGYVFQGFCPHGWHNRMADILFKTGEGGLHAMLHEPLEQWSVVPLVVLFVIYHLLAIWTYGLSISSGVFIPSLLIGSIWGRVVGIAVMRIWPGAGINISKYALIGAAANLGGATRMTLSLTIIIIECTGDIMFGVPIIIALICAKWVGDFINPGIYDMHIEIQGIPVLPWEPPAMSYNLKGSDVMTSPVECLNIIESVARLRSIADNPTAHHGYPVVENYYPNRTDHTQHGRLKGFILDSHIKAILADLSVKNGLVWSAVDLRPYMDLSPYTIQENISLPRIFKIFRGLGLRHLVVVNDRNRVIGMITRINLARYRQDTRRGYFTLKELEVAKE